MRKTANSAIRRLPDLPMAIATDIGLVRAENQDRAVIFRAQLTGDTPTIIAVICDGMGGMKEGGVCSALAISNFLSSYIDNRDIPIKSRIIQAVIQANNAVFAQYKGSGGSTLSAWVIEDEANILGVNVGDSRIYSIGTDNINQLSIDDTLAGQLANKNIIGSNN
jgi:serine/threonine protein phosphatase PrpC